MQWGLGVWKQWVENGMERIESREIMIKDLKEKCVALMIVATITTAAIFEVKNENRDSNLL